MQNFIYNDGQSLLRTDYSDVFPVTAIMGSNHPMSAFKDTRLISTASDIVEPDAASSLSIKRLRFCDAAAEAEHAAGDGGRVAVEIVIADGAPSALKVHFETSARVGSTRRHADSRRANAR